MRYVVDTHALVWFLSRDSRLGGETRQILAHPTTKLIIPTIVLAEAKHISDRKRVHVTFDEIMRAIVATPRITIFPLDIFVVANLPGNLDIHDGLIVATALTAHNLFAEDITILTRDEAITASGLAPVVW